MMVDGGTRGDEVLIGWILGGRVQKNGGGWARCVYIYIASPIHVVGQGCQWQRLIKFCKFRSYLVQNLCTYINPTTVTYLNVYFYIFGAWRNFFEG